MSYKLEKPYTELQYADFVVEHNHNNGRKIAETENAVYALELNEIIGEDGVPLINPSYETEQAQRDAEYRIEEIKTALYELDLEAIRPLRAILAGTQTDEDLEKIKEIETKAKELRIKIQPLKSL